jgi:GNAT superfamily N-acetyltransferase
MPTRDVAEAGCASSIKLCPDRKHAIGACQHMSFTMSDQDQSDCMEIAWVDTDAAIQACLPVLRELRPHIGGQGDFVSQVRRLQQRGYRLAAVWCGDRIVACAGCSIVENLIRGRYLHIDELMTARSFRSKGVGQRLLQALIEEAHSHDCQALLLECGLPNRRAHSFYFREGLHISAFRFGIAFDQVSGRE